jgi:hypothetical protein
MARDYILELYGFEQNGRLFPLRCPEGILVSLVERLREIYILKSRFHTTNGATQVRGLSSHSFMS